MKKYKKIKKLEAAEFRRLTGVKPETFLEMVSILQQVESIRMFRGGKPHRLRKSCLTCCMSREIFIKPFFNHERSIES
jgi:hypothetical protein